MIGDALPQRLLVLNRGCGGQTRLAPSVPVTKGAPLVGARGQSPRLTVPEARLTALDFVHCGGLGKWLVYESWLGG
jgi:hypothetical protein